VIFYYILEIIISLKNAYGNGKDTTRLPAIAKNCDNVKRRPKTNAKNNDRFMHMHMYRHNMYMSLPCNQEHAM